MEPGDGEVGSARPGWSCGHRHLVQGLLESLKVPHPLHSEAVVYYVCLVHGHHKRELGLVEDAVRSVV